MEKLKGIVRSSTDPKEWNGIVQIGFTLESDAKKWYNVDGEEEVLIELKKAVVSKGNEIEFEYDKGKVGNITLIAIAKPKESGGGWEDDIVNFETLLNDAHDKFKEKLNIKTELISVDFEKKNALFKATIIIEADNKDKNQVFEGHGDATGENVTGEHIKPHFIRMAETRAIVRALRWATNNAACAEEEKSDNPPKKQNETNIKKRG